MKSGKVKLRSKVVEKIWARILREAGGKVRENVLLRDAGVVGVDVADGRHIEVVVTGLPIAHGVPVAVDASIVSPLHADGTPHKDADVRPGISLGRAERAKETTYPELLRSGQLRLETVACEVGGRLSSRALNLLDIAAGAKVRCEPAHRQKFLTKWWRHRWMTMIAVAIQSCVASTLVNDGCTILDGCDGPAPSARELESREPGVGEENPYPGSGRLNTLTHD